MKNELCVPVNALGIGGGAGVDGAAAGGGLPTGETMSDGGAGAPGPEAGGSMVTPEGGDVVEFSGKGRVTRIEGANAYIEATEINGQPVAGGMGAEDEDAAMDREMAGMASGGGGGGLSTALGLVIACLMLFLVGKASAKEDLLLAGWRASSGGQVSNYVAYALPTQAFSVEIDNYSGSTLYLMIFDSATNSLNGRPVQFVAVPVPTGSVGFKDWNAASAPFDYGVNVCLSTTPYSLTNASTGGAVTVIHSGGAK